MKVKLISALLAALMIFSTALPAYAADTMAQSTNISLSIEELFGKLVVCLARMLNKLSDKNEADIPRAERGTPSWTAYDALENISPEETISTQAWLLNELTLESTRAYADAFNEVDIDLLLFGNGRLYKIPGFWDGNGIWKIRFACPLEGVWYYKTICSDESNTALHNRTGKIICSPYSGDYNIYKHGFVTTLYGEKYFTYDDGTAFFYLGDTHWSLGDETTDMVEVICQKRASQGFTVFQSEPIGAAFDFTNGITQDDMAGLAAYDERFQIIADYGLVHANAQFFFTDDMDKLIRLNGGYSDNGEISEAARAYLDKISRYWVARYGAYPVIWTLGQECDNDFYWSETNHPQWNYKNNPYKLVAEYISSYDAYDHPLTAHQENTGKTSAYGNGKKASDSQRIYNKNAESSCFRDVAAHSFYAAQWTPSKIRQSNFNAEKDYWYNSQGKPAINYEGQYCYLWTKNFGARMQGYLAFLNGMYGYGWGAHDTWSYLTIYDEANTSTDGVDIITSEDKINATWQDALEFESSYQSGYMRSFLESTQWYNLIPRFDNKAYFVAGSKVFYTYASNKDNTDIVIYFYSFSDESVAQKPNASNRNALRAGTIGSLLPNTEYTYCWFNPITGEYIEHGEFTSDSQGTFFIKQKPLPTDLAIHISIKE